MLQSTPILSHRRDFPLFPGTCQGNQEATLSDKHRVSIIPLPLEEDCGDLAAGVLGRPQHDPLRFHQALGYQSPAEYEGSRGDP